MKKILIIAFTFFLGLNSLATEIDPTSTPNSKKKAVSLSKEDCKTFGISPIVLQNEEEFLPRYDGENYFIDVEGMRKVNPTAEITKLRIQEVISKATNVIDCNDVNKLVTGLLLTEANLQSLPLVIKVEPTDGKKIKFYAVLLSLTFKQGETLADFAIVTDKSPFKNAENSDESEIFYMGATNVQIKRGGMMQGNLTLISPKRIKLAELEGFGELDLTLGTGICMECDGNKRGVKFNLAGSFIFNPDRAVAEKPDGTPDTDKPSPEIFFGLQLDEWQPIIAFKLPITYGIQFKAFPNLSFWSGSTTADVSREEIVLCDIPPAMLNANLYLDLSTANNPPIPNFPPGFKRGLIFSNMKVLLPKEVKKTTPKTNDEISAIRQEIDLMYLGITNEGVYAKGSANNLNKKLKLGEGYDIALQSVGLEIDKNKLKQFFLRGDLRLPIFDKNDYALDFLIGMKRIRGANSLDDIYFGAGLKSTSENQIPINMFGTGVKAEICHVFVGTVEFDENERVLGKGALINNWNFNELAITIEKGTIGLEQAKEGEIKKSLKSFAFSFEKIVVSNVFPFITTIDKLVAGKKTFSCSDGEDPPVTTPNELLGFGFGIEKITYDRATNEGTQNKFVIGADVKLELGFAQKEGKQGGNVSFDVGGKFAIKGHVDKNESQYVYAFDDINLNGIKASADLPTFYMSAEVSIFDEGSIKFGVPVRGGFEGAAKFGIKMAGGSKDMDSDHSNEKGAGAHAIFLQPSSENEPSAWAVDLKLSFGSGVPSTGLYKLKGLSGGAYKNFMVSGTPDAGGSPKTNTGYRYKIGKWGFKIGADMTLNTVNLNVMFMAQGATGRGLDWIKALGYANFPVDYSDIIPPVISNMATKVAAISTSIEGSIGLSTILKSNGSQTKDDSKEKKPQFNDNSYRAIEGVMNTVATIFGISSTSKNRIGAAAVITLAMNNSGSSTGGDDPKNDTEQGEGGYFSIYLKPDINLKFNTVANTSVTSTGYGLLYMSSTAKYLFLGKPDDRLGVTFDMSAAHGGVGVSASAFVNAYFMLGDQIESTMPKPMVPSTVSAEFESVEASLKDSNGETRKKNYRSNYTEAVNGTGLAFGAAVGVNFALSAVGVLNVNAAVGLGFDALIVQNDCPGWIGDTDPTNTTNPPRPTTSKNWHGSAQVYGFGRLNVRTFSIDLAEFGLGFLLNASIPQPIYAEGRFYLKLKVWRSEVNLKVKGQIGDQKPTVAGCFDNDAPSPNPPPEYVKMINDFSPKNNQVFPRTGLMHLTCELPEDQLNLVNSGPSTFKQEILYKITDENGNVVSANDPEGNGWAVENSINPKDIDGHKFVRISPRLEGTKTFAKGEKYKIEVRTRIYTEGSYTNDSGESVTDKETVYQKVDGVSYFLQEKDSKFYEFIIGQNDFVLSPEDVLLYPAQDQYNVYQNDYSGNGFFKVNKLVATKLNIAKASVGSAVFNLKVYDDQNNVLITKLLDNNWETDFDLNSLTKNKKYEVRIVGLVDGTEIVMLKDHFFRVDEYDTFNEKITAISTNYKYHYNANLLAIDLSYDGASTPNLQFSNEEKETTLSLLPDETKQWFSDFKNSWFEAFENTVYQFRFKKDVVKLNQSSLPYYEKGVQKSKTTSSSDLKPSFSYAPFEDAVWDFFASKDIYGAGDALIPKVSVDEDVCILAKHDISKLDYFQIRDFEGLTSGSGLPSRVQEISSSLCFKNEEEIDFNDITKVKKKVEITCKRGKLDSDPTELTFALKRDGKLIDFEAPFDLKFYSKIKTSCTGVIFEKEPYELIKIEGNLPANKQYISLDRKSVDQCPIACTFEVVKDKSKYQIEVIVSTREVFKPCLTFKDVTQEEAQKQCDKLVFEDCGSDADCRSGIDCGNLTSGDYYVKIEAWENEQVLLPQKVDGIALLVEFSNGQTASILPGRAESEAIRISADDMATLSIVVNASKDYICGINKDKVNYLSNLKPFVSVGKGSSETAACGSSAGSTIYALVNAENINIHTTNGTQFFSKNTIMPAPPEQAGFYSFSKSGGQKEYYQLNSEGKLIGKGNCANGKPVLCLSVVKDPRKSASGQDFRLNYHFYTDQSKATDYTPKNIPSDGLKITLSSGSYVTIQNNTASGSRPTQLDSPEFSIAEIVPANLFEICLPAVENCPNGPAAPVITASSSMANFGETITLTANGCTGGAYSWFNGNGGETLKDVITKASTYSVKCIINNCKSEGSTIAIAVKAMTISSDDSKDYACSGVSKTLTLQGCSGSVLWTSLDATISNPTTMAITISPTKEINLKVSCTSSTNVVQVATYKLNYFESPIAPVISFDAVQTGVVIGNTITICENEPVKLNATSCSTAGSSLLWSNGATTNSITVNPIGTTVYSVRCTNNKCESAKSDELSVSVRIMKKAIIGNPVTTQNNKVLYNNKVCTGVEYQLSETACDATNTIEWFENGVKINETGVVVKITKSAGGNYLYTSKCVQNIGTTPAGVKECKGVISSSVSVTVIDAESGMSIAIIPPTNGGKICSYSEQMLVSSGCTHGIVQWKKGLLGTWGTQSNKIVKGSDGSDTYYVRCNLNDNCTKETSIYIDVTSEPSSPTNLISSGTDNQICEGTTVSLNGTCTNSSSIKWENLTGNTSTPTYTDALSSKTFSYKAYCTITTGSLTCETQNGSRPTLGVIVYKVPPVPTIIASLGQKSENFAEICDYQFTNISVGNYSGSLLWKVNEGNEQGPVAGFNDINTSSTYSARSKNWQCYSSHSSNYTVQVNTRPAAPTITSSETSYTCGKAVTLTASSCSGGTVNWSNGSKGISIALSDVQNTDYTATCTDSKTCGSPASTPINVEIREVPSKPTITGSSTYCVGDEVNLVATTTTANASIVWSNYNPASKPKPDAGDYTYNVTAIKNSCSSASTGQTVSVYNYLSAPTISSDATTFTCGTAVTLTATGCSGTVHWSNGGTGTTITLRDAQNTNYTAYCSDSKACDSPASTAINVEIREVPAKPTISGSNTYCVGSEINLIAATTTANANIEWSNYNPASKPKPEAGDHTYYVAASKNSCSSDAQSQKVTVFNYPASPVVSPAYNCGSTNLTITNCTGGTAHFEWGSPDMRFSENNGFAAIAIRYSTYCEQNGCTTQGNNYTPTVMTAPTAATLTTTKTNLCNDETTNISLSNENGDKVQYFREKANLGGTMEVGSKGFLSINDEGVYYTTHTVSSGETSCTSTSNRITIIKTSSEISAVAFNQNPCEYLLSVTSSACSDEQISWIWENKGGQQGSKSIATRLPGTYRVSCNNQGCETEKTYNIRNGHPSSTSSNWVDTDVTSCVSDPTTNIITCTKEQEDRNLCSSSFGRKKYVVTNVCSEIINVTYNPSTDSFSAFTPNAGCQSTVKWYYRGNVDVDLEIGEGASVNAYKGGGRYEAKCTNPCGTVSVGSDYKD